VEIFIIILSKVTHRSSKACYWWIEKKKREKVLPKNLKNPVVYLSNALDVEPSTSGSGSSSSSSNSSSTSNGSGWDYQFFT